jgi:hypothetical protein
VTASTNLNLIFPNKVFVYNYRTKAFSIFRDNVTAFGYLQLSDPSNAAPNVNWSDFDVLWSDDSITWSDTVQSNPGQSVVVSGNQEGYVHQYAANRKDDRSLSIQAITITNFGTLNQAVILTIPNHNLIYKDTIYIDPQNVLTNPPTRSIQYISSTTGLPVATTGLIGNIFSVIPLSQNTIQIALWDYPNQPYTTVFPVTFAGGLNPTQVTYVGGGEISLFPKLKIISKDINPYQVKGLSTKLAYIDFLLTPTRPIVQTVPPNPNPYQTTGVSVSLWINSATQTTPSTLVPNPLKPPFSLTGNVALSTVPKQYFYPAGSEYAWFRFYSTLSFQYFNIMISYDDNFMNDLNTHTNDFVLYAINAFVKRGGKIPF